jgi:murein L,D-transpeptidase YcbB/YkuD
MLMQKEIKLSYIILLAAVVVLAIVLLIVFVIQGEPSLTEQLTEVMQAQFSASDSSTDFIVGTDTTNADTLLTQFYRQRNFRPAWISDKGLQKTGEGLLNAIHDADREGLNPNDYHVQLLDSMLHKFSMDLKTKVPVQIEHLLNLEILLTDAFLLYGNHLLSGRINPQTIDPEWLTTRPEADMIAILNEAISSSQVRQTLMSLLPDLFCYAGLRQELVLYKSIALQGGWPIVPPGENIKKGDRGLRVAALSARLIGSGDLKERSLAARFVFDDTLELAVKNFQKRHGLQPDGEVGSSTIEALNIPALDYFRRIAVNMERWRWLSRDLGQRYILVNIAAFTLDVVENGATVFSMPVVVGKDYRRTPVFSAKMTYIVLNPYWNVPETIATEDILTAVKRDPGYLKKRNIEVLPNWRDTTRIDPFKVDWASFTKENLPYRFRQAPGRQNALGRIKFMFPNEYDIYIHDTPSKADFRRTQRAFSSGCIRVEDPVELAAYLLQGDSRWTRETIVAALDSVADFVIRLPESIPVHIFYCTAWVDEDRKVNFRQDVYDRDRLVVKALRAEAAWID